MIKYIDEFRNQKAAAYLLKEIKKHTPDRTVNLMEICGGHTATIMKFGIKQLLPSRVVLKSGPGCPVCVTDQAFIDTAIELAAIPQLIITSFGDMMRVPGSRTSLLALKMEKRDIRICLSPMDALKIAEENPDRQVVFLGIGFETTAPGIAVAIQTAWEHKLRNFSVLSALKTMPRALNTLVEDGEINIQGFICPGHVSTITGTGMYEPFAHDYGLPCVVSGFEPTDMLKTIDMILLQIKRNQPRVEIQYTRAVTRKGNKKAQQLIEEVFKPVDIIWRGMGSVPQSGLGIRKKYVDFDTARRYQVNIPETRENSGCICGRILKSLALPIDCTLFARSCTPEHPVGACMVSSEGSCAIYYKYR
jgi:hydrogenase expression/formation protein HypD